MWRTSFRNTRSSAFIGALPILLEVLVSTTLTKLTLSAKISSNEENDEVAHFAKNQQLQRIPSKLTSLKRGGPVSEHLWASFGQAA